MIVSTQTHFFADTYGLEASIEMLADAGFEGLDLSMFSLNTPIFGDGYKEYAEKIESFQILAGYLDGAVVNKDTVLALADIPSKEVLLAKFLGSIRSPLYGLAYALQAVVDKDNEQEAPAAEAQA